MKVRQYKGLAQYERAVRASERRLARAICTFRRGPGYEVFQSEEFPGFYAGNGIVSDGTRAELGIDEWVAIFRSHFPRERYHHVTLVFPHGTAPAELFDEARQRGLRVFPEVLMAAPVRGLERRRAPGPAGQAPQLLDLARDRERLFELHLLEAATADWFDSPESFRGLFNKTMALSERLGMEWLAVGRADGHGPLEAALAYFDEQPVCRLQEVITSPAARRRGLATRLIRETAARAARRGIAAIGLVAEEGEDGHRLYRSLGFAELSRDVTIMEY
jgi:ribosomal protein S18 acetylase RimI-like enzyme